MTDFSDLANPAIQPAEVTDVETAICRVHGGMLRYGRTLMDREGQVFFCPSGNSYWRLNRVRNDVNQLPQLQYGWNP